MGWKRQGDNGSREGPLSPQAGRISANGDPQARGILIPEVVVWARGPEFLAGSRSARSHGQMKVRQTTEMAAGHLQYQTWHGLFAIADFGLNATAD